MRHNHDIELDGIMHAFEIGDDICNAVFNNMRCRCDAD